MERVVEDCEVTDKLKSDNNIEVNSNENVIGHKSQKDSWFLYFAAFAVNLITLSIGCVLVWPSPVIPKLKSSDVKLNPLGQPATTLQISLIAGLFSLGCIIGPMFLGKLLDNYARKKTLIFFSICSVLCYVITAFARNLQLYYISRFALGVSLSGCMSVMPVFLMEISEDHNRGRISCLNGLFYPLGNLYGYLVGPFFSVKIFTLLCGLPLLMHVVFLGCFVPESPIYLATLNKKKKTLNALDKFRNKSPSCIEKDMEEIFMMLRQNNKSTDAGYQTILATKALRRSFAVALGLSAIQIFCGSTTLMAYIGPIFDAAETGISGDATGILVAVVKIIFYSITSLLVERLGRRPLLLFSSLGVAMSIFSLGLYFHLKEICEIEIAWLPILSIVCFFSTYSFGLGPLPMTVAVELFPSEIRSFGVSVMVLVTYLQLFLGTFSFPLLVELIGTAYCMWLFSACCLIGFAFIYFLVPETKAKSFTEIQKLLER